MIIYKIRDRQTGLFSTGGLHPSFSKKGKIWKQKGHLSNHFSNVNQQAYARRDCEVVEYELIENEMSTASIVGWVDAAQQRRDDREAAYKQSRLKYELERNRAEYERLRKQFEGK